jgi:chromate transporter
VNESLLWTFVRIFVPLSFVTIGGGASIIAEVKRQSVDVNHWITASQFVDLFAVSRAAPGPGSLLVSLIGFQVDGVAGALVVTLALFAPPSIVLYGVAHVWRRHRGATWQHAIERGLQPIAAGLVLAAVAAILRSIEGGIMAWLVAAGALVALRTLRVNPLVLLAAGATIFVIVEAYWTPT